MIEPSEEKKTSVFQSIVLIAILLQSIILAIDTPLDDPESTKNKVLEKINLVFTVFFLIEITIKCIAFGILLNGTNSYFRDIWNIIDFIIIILSVIFSS